MKNSIKFDNHIWAHIFCQNFYIWNNAHSIYSYTEIHTLFKCYTQIQFVCENTNYLEKNYL